MNMKRYRMPYELPNDCSSFACDEKVTPTSCEVEVLPNPYDSMEAYFNGTPIPSFAPDTVYNEIEGSEVTRYAKDTFEAIESLKAQQRLQQAADKRAKQSAEKASAASAESSSE